MSIQAETPMLVYTMHAYNITDEASNDFNKYFVRNSNSLYMHYVGAIYCS